MTDSTTAEADTRPGESGGDDSGEEAMDILEMREHVAEVATALLDDPFEGITSLERTDDGGWQTAFEVVERSAVPDTQDIIGRYQLHLSATGAVEEYSLQQRFKRSELQGESL